MSAARGRISNVYADVRRFEIQCRYVDRFDVQRVGGRGVEGLWVPAHELDEFTPHIVGRIEVVAEYR